MKKKWPNLKSLCEYFLESKEEKVVHYYGYELITDKNRYTMAFGKLIKKPL